MPGVSALRIEQRPGAQGPDGGVGRAAARAHRHPGQRAAGLEQRAQRRAVVGTLEQVPQRQALPGLGPGRHRGGRAGLPAAHAVCGVGDPATALDELGAGLRIAVRGVQRVLAAPAHPQRSGQRRHRRDGRQGDKQQQGQDPTPCRQRRAGLGQGRRRGGGHRHRQPAPVHGTGADSAAGG